MANRTERGVTKLIPLLYFRENFSGAAIMNRRNEMGGIRVERTQYRRWGGQ